MEYTVKQLSGLAGVSVRTLHFYDEIGLLRPARVGANGYRYYGDAAVLRLQQILFYKELGLSLDEIAEVLDQPEFDVARPGGAPPRPAAAPGPAQAADHDSGPDHRLLKRRQQNGRQGAFRRL